MRVQLVDDRELVRRYLRGDEAAFQILINRHKNKIFTYIMMIIKDRHKAEDVFQDVFIKVINTLKKGKYNEEGKFLPWVMRIAHNLVIDHFRKSNKMPIADGGEDYDIVSTIRFEDPNIEDRLVTDQIHSDLKLLIDELPEEQKEVLVMRHYGGMSFKDIAEQTDVSINTALGRMRYALINLRKAAKERNIVLHRD